MDSKDFEESATAEHLGRIERVLDDANDLKFGCSLRHELITLAMLHAKFFADIT